MSTGPRFTDDDVREFVRTKNRDGLALYFEMLGAISEACEFVRMSKPSRENVPSKISAAFNLRLARAKLRYKEHRDAGMSVNDARAAMVAEFPMETTTAVRLTEGNITRVNRICDELADPAISKQRGKKDS